MKLRSLRHPCLLVLTLGVGLGISPVAVSGDSAAAIAAANGAACQDARPFYWEIGNVNGPLVSGHVDGPLGLVTYHRNTRMNLASASKWVLGAYMMEVDGGVPPAHQREAAMMLTGYNNFNSALCQLSLTVGGCFYNIIGNDKHSTAADGSFFYSGGNSQYLAASPALLDLGDMTTAQLSNEIQTVVGTTMTYQYPAVSAGLKGSAAEYADFLVRLMTPPAQGGLIMHDYLGVARVATLPCPTNASGCSPAGTVAWTYGYEYWVENNVQSGLLTPGGPPVGPGDGAYSSPGAWGFYPWISHDQSLYGIVARRGLSPTAFRKSALCGMAIRYAFTGYTP